MNGKIFGYVSIMSKYIGLYNVSLSKVSRSRRFGEAAGGLGELFPQLLVPAGCPGAELRLTGLCKKHEGRMMTQTLLMSLS